MKTLTKKKKIVILSVMIALLLVTGFVNVALNSTLSSDLSTTTSTTNANFYSTYRTDRENTRLQEIQHYDEIIASATASEESKYKYFLVGSSVMNQEHAPNGEFTEGGQIFEYPTLSISNYE